MRCNTSRHDRQEGQCPGTKLRIACDHRTRLRLSRRDAFGNRIRIS